MSLNPKPIKRQSAVGKRFMELDTPRLTRKAIPIDSENGLPCYDAKIIKNKDGTFRVHAFLQPRFVDIPEKDIKIKMPDGAIITKRADTAHEIIPDSKRDNAWADADHIQVYRAHSVSIDKNGDIDITPSNNQIMTVNMIPGHRGRTIYFSVANEEDLLKNARQII